MDTYQKGDCPMANRVPKIETGMVETNMAQKTDGICGTVGITSGRRQGQSCGSLLISLNKECFAGADPPGRTTLAVRIARLDSADYTPSFWPRGIFEGCVLCQEGTVHGQE